MKHPMHMRDDWFVKRFNHDLSYEAPGPEDPDEFCKQYYGQTNSSNFSYIFSNRRVER